MDRELSGSAGWIWVKMLTIGTILQERYRIDALLGQGGMGAVYHAHHLKLNISVAIKEMIPQPGLDTATLAHLRHQFQQEASVLAQLNHPHLVRVRDFFEESGSGYLVMEFVEGESLASRIARQGALSEAEALACAGQLLGALAYCHDKGVLHRDVKPQNVIIRPDGQTVLVDFGLVKLWDPRHPRTRSVLRGMGTPEYAPPEQYGAQPGHTDPRSDIYSVGATLYHALTGQIPPAATDRIADPEQFARPRELNPRVSRGVEALVLRAMALARSQRFQSAREMSAALAGGRAGTGRAVATRPERAKVIPSVRRSGGVPGWAWGLGCVGLLGLVVGVVAVVQAIAGAGGAPAPRATSLPTPAPTAAPTTVPSAAPATVAATEAQAGPGPTEPPPPIVTPAEADPALGDTLTRLADGMVMVYAPAGEFEMGSTDDEVNEGLELCKEYYSDCQRYWDDREQPAHTVELDGFWIDRTEVTNAQYQRCEEAGYCDPPSDSGSYSREAYYGESVYDDHPVIYVSWHQAVAYCEWAGARLPWEAEYEYAARGPERWAFPWGDDFDGSRLNYCDTNCGWNWADGGVDDGYADTAPVGSYPGGASWCGARDLAGNVREWVADWYGDYPSKWELNPMGPPSGELRVLRGGSWGDDPNNARGASRNWYYPDHTYYNNGFRCARSLH